MTKAGEFDPVENAGALENSVHLARKAAIDGLHLLPRVGIYAATGLLSAVPAAAYQALHTTVNDELGTFPVTVTLAPGDTSKITALPKQNVYLPVTKYGYGAKVQLDDLPPGGIDKLLAPDTLQKLTGLYDNPKDAAKGYEAAIIHAAERTFIHDELVLGAAMGTILFTVRYARAGQSVDTKRRVIESRRAEAAGTGAKPPSAESLPETAVHEAAQNVTKTRRKRVAALIATLVMTPIGVATSDYIHNAQPEHTYVIPGLEGTALAGTSTDNQYIFDGITRGVPKAIEYKQRLDAQRELFIATASSSLAKQASQIVIPGANEEAILIGSDEHGNQAQTKLTTETVALINKLSVDSPIRMVVMGGDLGYGSAGENHNIKQEGKIGNGAPEYSVVGNHDTDITKEQMKDAHITNLNKQLVDSKTKLRLSGAEDPEVTKYFEATSTRYDQTESEVGKKLYQTDVRRPADITVAHEGFVIGAYLDLKTTTKESLKKWFDERGSNTVPYEDGVRDLPTHLLIYGHWHRIVQPRTVWNSDGSHTLVMELNTMGGAIGNPTFNRFSLPNGAPAQTASFPVVYMDKTSGMVTGYQMYTFQTDGNVHISKRINIGEKPSVDLKR